MSDYGTHPTRYGNLSNEDLYSMYRESTFTKLSDEQKLDLLQETVNRDAEERGMVGAPQVTFENFSPSVGGQARNGVVQINQEMVLNGTQTFTRNGQTQVNQLSDANIQAFNSVIHENIHSWQEQIIDGTITIDDAQKTAEYQANDFTETAVLQNGSYKMGSQYLTGKTSRLCYYFQSTERDAYKGAEEKTASLLQALTEKFGTEKSFQAYEKSVACNGYAATEKRANEFYQNNNFEKDLNQVLMNHYYGTKTQVDAKTENAVKTEMISSYKEINSGLKNSNSMEEKGMGLHGPVSLESYNQSIENNNAQEMQPEQTAGPLEDKGAKTDMEEDEQVENDESTAEDMDADEDAGDDLDGGDDDLDI